MEYRILGPFEVSDNGRGIEIGGPKQRALLAVLLLHANEVVSPDVADRRAVGRDASGDSRQDPPGSRLAAAEGAQRRRRAPRRTQPGCSGPAGAATSSGSSATSSTPTACGTCWSTRVALVARASPELAAHELRRALACWRGPALADFAYESFAQAEIARLDELQLTALEERIEADLALGRDGELVSELEALVARHPLRERLRGQLMLALYRSDRQAEALHVYQEGRLALAQEVGLEPSQGLQRLERRILEQDPVLAGPGRRERPRIGRAPSPAVVRAGSSSPASPRLPSPWAPFS